MSHAVAPDEFGRAFGDLVEAAGAFERPDEVLRLAAAAVVATCPRSESGVYAIADWPARRVVAVSCFGGGQSYPEIGQAYASVYGSTMLGYQRSLVAPLQRDRWVEPMRSFVRPDEFRSSAGYNAAFAPHRLWNHGRRVYCSGGRPIAYACAMLPEGEDFHDEERLALERTAERLGPILRLLSAVSLDAARVEGLDHLLAERPDPCALFSSSGAFLGASAAGVRAFERCPDLVDAIHVAIRPGLRSPVSVRVGVHVVHLTPCSPRGGSSAIAVLIEHRSDDSGRRRITARQAHILELLELGFTNARIADELGLAAATVKTQLERLYRRAGVRNRTELVRWSRT